MLLGADLSGLERGTVSAHFLLGFNQRRTVVRNGREVGESGYGIRFLPVDHFKLAASVKLGGPLPSLLLRLVYVLSYSPVRSRGGHSVWETAQGQPMTNS